MVSQDVVVVGASAGGVEALVGLVEGLPTGLPAALFVVLHIPPDAISHLPQILARSGALPAAHAEDGEPIRPGRIYVAPPNHHLLLRGNHVRVTVGPRVNGVRPSIDMLFQSAAQAFDGRVIGVVLSGTLTDGALGLDAIRLRGGVTVIQDPQEAKFSGMPLSALQRVRTEHVLPVAEISGLIVRQTATTPATTPRGRVLSAPGRNSAVNGDPTTMHASNGAASSPHEKRGNLASGFTCPTCHGSLWELENDGLTRIECRVGHAFSVDAFLDEQAIALEDALWSAINALEERGSALHRFASRFAQSEQRHTRYLGQAEVVERQAAVLREGLVRVIQAEEFELSPTDGA